jgi:HprK-related kinase A
MPPENRLLASDLQTTLRREQFKIQVGPYVYGLSTNLPLIIEGVQTLYSESPLAAPTQFVDYRVGVHYASSFGRLRRRAEFHFEHQRLFAPVKTDQAYASLEWGMNWCVSVHANEYLKLHAAVIAKDDRAIIMPGVPGAGKSTLCAAMGLSGWRILSDEHALVPPGTDKVVPLCRPVSLKNESIPLIRSFHRNAIFGPISHDTHKGVVAHMKADLAPECHDTEPVAATSMVFPRYSKSDGQKLSPRTRTSSFILAAYHSFNYSLLGSAGFHAMTNLVDKVKCYDLVYHDLEWAIRTLEQLHDGNKG